MSSDNIGASAAGPTRPMRELPDFTVASGNADVRGWPVVTPDGAQLGTVRELMVDTGAMRVASLDVELNADGERGRTTLPVESMQVDSTRHVVVATGTTANTRATPTDIPVASAAAAQVKQTDDEIRVPIVEDQLVVERRPVVKEEIVIRKSAVTREKKVEADLRKERVEIDRTDQKDSR